MKNYIVLWECNNWASFNKLDAKYRESIESKFNSCCNLADLFNRINKHLEILGKDFYPEVIDIREA